MNCDSEELIKDIRAKLENILDFVSGEAAAKSTADHVERNLFKLLLSMGAKLLLLFFTMRSNLCSRESIQTEKGETLPYHRDTYHNYFSIFGKISFKRPYFYKQGVGGQIPLDGELSLGKDCYSDFLREILEYLGVYNVYGKGVDILERILGISISTRVLKHTICEDSTDVEAYYEQKLAPLAVDESEILVIQADGKGVPIILEEAAEANVRLGKGQKHGQKKESIVTAIYSIKPAIRKAKEVVASFFKLPVEAEESKIEYFKPANKQIWATLDGKDTALSRLSTQAAKYDGSHIKHRVALCDGCEALQTRINTHFPNFTLILDFIHASEYLWDVANRLLGEKSAERLDWMAKQTLRILSGETQQLIDEFLEIAKKSTTTALQKEQLKKTAEYFKRNLPFMDYSTYLANGWPIASGVIEGACRHFVKDRCELSGMRWNQDGAENLLRLRAVAENGDWDNYHKYRRQQRHIRLYGYTGFNPELLQVQSLNNDLAVLESVSSCKPDCYQKLKAAA
ncbi:MAG: ISKra4 family transposase [Desulfamplus sp.]|nr:ISKra4 family transposase [Desulfamplus sp.]